VVRAEASTKANDFYPKPLRKASFLTGQVCSPYLFGAMLPIIKTIGRAIFNSPVESYFIFLLKFFLSKRLCLV
jgi:hypothetical protein